MSNHIEIDWSKAPEGATHYALGAQSGHWRDLSGYNWKFWADGKWSCHGMLSSRLLEDPGNLVLIPRPSSPAWNGEGLPPVGVRCEAAIPHTSGPDNERSFIWIEGSVIAYYEIKGKTYAWFAEDDGFYPPNVMEFRPIRTPECIAAEDALSEIECLYSEGGPAAVYDAGYRKQEQPK